MILTGPVLSTRQRSGTKDGKEWTLTNVRVLDGDRIREVTLGRDLDVPADGEIVSYEVSLRPAIQGNGTATVYLTAYALASQGSREPSLSL